MLRLNVGMATSSLEGLGQSPVSLGQVGLVAFLGSTATKTKG